MILQFVTDAQVKATKTLKAKITTSYVATVAASHASKPEHLHFPSHPHVTKIQIVFGVKMRNAADKMRQFYLQAATTDAL